MSKRKRRKEKETMRILFQHVQDGRKKQVFRLSRPGFQPDSWWLILDGCIARLTCETLTGLRMRWY